MRLFWSKKRVALLAGAAVGIAAAATILPLTASGAAHQRLYIGMNLQFTGPTTAGGTFVASGAVSDSGSVSVDHLALVPIGHSDSANLSGDETFTSPSGTIVTHFEGMAFPLSSPPPPLHVSGDSEDEPPEIVAENSLVDFPVILHGGEPLLWGKENFHRFAEGCEGVGHKPVELCTVMTDGSVEAQIRLTLFTRESP